ncbi:MAG: site-specific DNA-methyltransferase, partial [Actinobacteria bacterium]|nr:site-specific DNA-methyltransferase [Actinomycetota bacterium]
MAERRAREGTATSKFGVSRRENHDSTSFYDRFPAPTLLDDDTVVACPVRDTIITGDARDLSVVPDNSIALVVTSPPYFAGKAYEAELGEGAVPASYLEYLEMLRDVFAEC